MQSAVGLLPGVHREEVGMRMRHRVLLHSHAGRSLMILMLLACITPAWGEAPDGGRRRFSTPDEAMLGMAYGPFRDGQNPDDGIMPSDDQVLEDLRILEQHWPFIRMYGARGAAQQAVRLIRDHDLDMKIMIGAWIAPEWKKSDESDAMAPHEANRVANRQEVEAVIDMAMAFPNEVMAVCVGSETQVYWSDHKVRPDIVKAYIREVRGRVKVPVTTADDFSFWEQEASVEFGHEVDFIVAHLYAMWNKQSLDDAIVWTETKYRDIAKRHPGVPIVIGEIGWATKKQNVDLQKKLILAPAGEDEQALFYNRLETWIKNHRIITFYFSAFDENWKGGDDPNHVEKHWGIYRSDRSAKRVLSTKSRR